MNPVVARAQIWVVSHVATMSVANRLGDTPSPREVLDYVDTGGTSVDVPSAETGASGAQAAQLRGL